MLQTPSRSVTLIGTAPDAARYSTARFATPHRHYCAGLVSMIDGGERYFGGFFTSLSISRHVSNST
jgi:hypothetical protein